MFVELFAFEFGTFSFYKVYLIFIQLGYDKIIEGGVYLAKTQPSIFVVIKITIHV
jgi:hypothetical protein